MPINLLSAENILVHLSSLAMLALGLEGQRMANPVTIAVLHMPHVVDRDHVDVARGMLPVAVTKMSACPAASSIVVT